MAAARITPISNVFIWSSHQLKTGCNRHSVNIVKYNGRPQEIIPYTGKIKQGNYSSTGLSIGTRIRGERPYFIRTVCPGRFIIFLWNSLQELPNQKNIRHTGKTRHDCGKYRTQPKEETILYRGIRFTMDGEQGYRHDNIKHPVQKFRLEPGISIGRNRNKNNGYYCRQPCHQC